MFMKLYSAAFLLLLLISFSCKSRTDNNFNYSLIPSNTKVSFPLNSDVKQLIKTLQYYKDNEGKEYLTFQNDKEPEILFYDMQTNKLMKTLTFSTEGPNNVGAGFIGYYMKSLDEIYLTRMDKNEVLKVNSQGMVLRQIPYPQTDNGALTVPSFSTTFSYTPIVFIDNKMYLSQGINYTQYNEQVYEKSPIALVIDTTSQSVQAVPFTFPPIVPVQKVIKYETLGTEFFYSRDFNGKDFVYSFAFDENIYITPKEHSSVKKINARSQYIKQVKPLESRPVEFQDGIKKWSEIAMYGNLLYDKYREVYYRISYPETAIGKNENFPDIWQYGRKLFSIIVLDKDFNTIGETLFPEYTYISTLMFIREDGLYISDSHYKNPHYNEDILSFRKFDLVESN